MVWVGEGNLGRCCFSLTEVGIIEWLKTLYENYFINTLVKELKPFKSSLQIKIVTELLHLIRMMLSKLSKYFKNPNNTVLSLSLLSWLLPPHCSNVEFYQFGCKYIPYGWWIPTALMVFGGFLKLWLRQIWEQPLPQYPSARGDGPVLLCEFKQWFYPSSPLQGTRPSDRLSFWCLQAGSGPQPVTATVSSPRRDPSRTWVPQGGFCAHL